MMPFLNRLFGRPKFKLEEGRVYRNREGELIPIVSRTLYTSVMYMYGYEFEDDEGRTYLANGQFSRHSRNDRRDLVELVS